MAAASNSTAVADPFRTRESDHAFFTAMAIVSSVTIAGGFLSTYGARLAAGDAQVPAIIHVHAAVFSAWLALFVTQSLLVSRGRTSTHKRLGVAGAVLAPILLAVALAASITVTRAGHRGIPGVEFPTPAGFLLLNVNAALIFFVLFGAAWYFRHNSQMHKRLMLTSVTGAMVGPGASRLPFASGRTPVIAVLVLAFLFAGPVYDLLTRRRIHRAYWFAIPVALLGIPPIVGALAETAAWRSIAGWMLR